MAKKTDPKKVAPCGCDPSETPAKQWTAFGRVYQPDSGMASQNPTDFVIKERSRSVSMDTGNKAYGQPIDAQLSIHLIQHLFKVVGKYGQLDFLRMGPEELTRKLNSKKKETPPPGGWKKYAKWLSHLLCYSKAITIDKNIILKTLSQPCCEGLRFYLCLTPPPSTGKGKTSKPPKGFPEGTFSLVTVGVDANGKDLHYDYQKLTDKEHFADLETVSLTGEYGHPPGGEGEETQLGPLMQPELYVLWAYASDLHELID